MEASQTPLQQHIWRNAYLRLVPLLALTIFGAVLCDINGNLRGGDIGDKLLCVAGVTLFLVGAIGFLQTLTHTFAQVLSAHPARRLNSGRAGALKFMMRLFGYIAIALITLNLTGFSIGNLLLGGAALGIILGVAAQQALANLFASIVLIITHPFAVGDKLRFNSGALGGIYEGTVTDIGLTHTKLKLDESSEIVLLPNATILSGATVTFAGKPKR